MQFWSLYFMAACLEIFRLVEPNNFKNYKLYFSVAEKIVSTEP